MHVYYVVFCTCIYVPLNLLKVLGKYFVKPAIDNVPLHYIAANIHV